ncbi:MAG: hypothetical protein PHF86_11540 [Candidatus Nanoarchaeia archaeon]|nr:hypothetical protein [Candidatus Nanoarchaeia archaeon]
MTNLTIDSKLDEKDSAYVSSIFYEGKELLEKEGDHIISLEENARLRIQEGKNSSVSRHGNWTKAGLIYFPRAAFLVKESFPIMRDARTAYFSYMNIGNHDGGHYYLNNYQLREALIGSIEIPAQLESISCDQFGENKITQFLFGEYAKAYGKFLQESGIKEMPIKLCNLESEYFSSSKNFFATLFWFDSLNHNDSCLYGNLGLNFFNGVRGVQN